MREYRLTEGLTGWHDLDHVYHAGKGLGFYFEAIQMLFIMMRLFGSYIERKAWTQRK